MNLKEEDMTVAQYDTHFNQLSRFIENIVVQDSDKATKFLMGLRYDIYIQLMYEEVRTYNAIVFVAYRVEQVNVE